MSTAEQDTAEEYSRRLVVLFAALVAALGWSGVFEADAPPFDTTSSARSLPALAGAIAPAEAMAFAEPPSEPSVVVEFSAAPPEQIVPDVGDDVIEGEPAAGQNADPAEGAVRATTEPAEFVSTNMFAGPEAFEVYADSFDTVDGWQLFEQIIEPRPDCYATGAADFQSVGTDDRWLQLTANDGATTLSNHPILGQRLEVDAVSGLHRLTVMAMIDEGSGGNLQVGPELSVQNTVRAESGEHLTQTYGIQYEARAGAAHWNLWAAFGGDIGWRRVNTASLEEGEWYRIGLVFHTGTGVYHELAVEGPGGFTLQFDGVHSLWQNKSFDEEAVWVTLESENLFTCEDPREVTAIVNYDELLYERIG